MKATGAENLLARAFEGREVRMIVLAALMGGLSPFCSCEVIPFIAAHARGRGAAVGGDGLLAGLAADGPGDVPDHRPANSGCPSPSPRPWRRSVSGCSAASRCEALARSALFADPLKNAPVKSCGCSSRPASPRARPTRRSPAQRRVEVLARTGAAGDLSRDGAREHPVSRQVAAARLPHRGADDPLHPGRPDRPGARRQRAHAGGARCLRRRAGLSQRLCRGAAGGGASRAGHEPGRGDVLRDRGRA